MRRAWLALTVLAFLGCGAAPEPERAELSSREPAAVGASRADREAVRAEGVASTTAPTVAPEPSAIVVPPLQLTRLDGTHEAEDGAGHVAPSERAVAIDLRADDFPPRALDPVLVVGALRFHHYRHPRIGVLRFVATSPELLEEGQRVAVDYEDGAPPTVVTPALVVPAEVRR